MRSSHLLASRALLPALALSLLAGLPSEGAAQEPACTEAYYLCLSSALSGGGAGVYDELASVECGVRWAGCVIRSFKGL